MDFCELLKRNQIIGMVGNTNTAKSSLILYLLSEFKKEYKTNVAVLGVENELMPILEECGIKFLHSKTDLLDLRIKDTIIFIDEMAKLFDSRASSKEQNKLMRFFDRIVHQNCKLIMGTARGNFFNKFICEQMTACIVKEIEYASLVNGTWLKERVKAITSTSDYRLEMNKNEYYLISTDGTPTIKKTFPYIKKFDTKKENKNLFIKKCEEKNEKKCEEKNEKKCENGEML
jgi:hypothetical protein